MHDLIASPFLDYYLILRPDSDRGVKISYRKYCELQQAAATVDVAPEWLVDAVQRSWGFNLTGRSVRDTVLVRASSSYGYGRASYELNLGCNYDCEHCYLGLKKFEGLDWPDRERLLYAMRDAGVLWLQLTGGEPMIDKLFTKVYNLAYEIGMMISISSNGSRLSNTKILDLLTSRRPYRLTLSVYGATAESYDGLTRRRGSFAAFTRGLLAAHEAGLPIALSLVVARQNAHEVDQMKAMAERLKIPYAVYTNMSPTIYGGPESLPTQAEEHLRKRKVFTGCNAGHTFFHVDPHGMASICKVGRDPQISLIDEGVEGLSRLGGIADSLLLRQGGCSGCTLSGTCGTCMPLATLYRKAKAPLSMYCQH
ncbi:radical SAM protein [Frankia sp. Cppng1_Ct_nod]|uniref:radical SAM protein n=1 Tax=Frankia sp. Cppng1_Ct_nod TaxID=2897162 RepID=UPI001585AA8D|nr:radical SAM protein [Frankia sp. Cppng1_Ct_nod]